MRLEEVSDPAWASEDYSPEVTPEGNPKELGVCQGRMKCKGPEAFLRNSMVVCASLGQCGLLVKSACACSFNTLHIFPVYKHQATRGPL